MDSVLRRLGWGIAVWVAVAVGQGAAAQSAGQGLLKVAGAEREVQLERAQLHSRVAAGLGETRIELVFRNLNNRVLEGNLEFPLADGQQVTAFALDIDGALRDAVPVPKDKGRQVFEAIERRGVDPGLLEQTAGNQFRLRIYPIPAHGTRRVALTVRETLPLDAKGLRWNLPMQFAQGAQQVQVQLDAVGTGVPVKRGTSPLELTLAGATWRARWQGRGDQLPAQLGWTLPLPRGISGVQGLFNGERYFMLQVPVTGQPRPRALPRRIGLVWDASGSGRQRDTAAELTVLDRYFQAVGQAQVQLTVLRDRAEPMRRFNVQGGNWSALRRELEGLVYDGGSALNDWAASPDVDETLVVSDGIGNFGARTRPALQPGQPLYALSGAGARTDASHLRYWVEGSGGQVLVLAGVDDVTSVAERLLRQAPARIEPQGQGLADLLLDDTQAGQGWVRVMGRITAQPASLRLRLPSADGSTTEQTMAMNGLPDADGGMAAYAWASHQLQRMQSDRTVPMSTTQAFALKFGLVSADTSLLVLETLEDYLRYGIRPPVPLQAEYDKRHALQIRDEAEQRRQRLDAIARQFAEREQWWNRSWPKGSRPQEPDPRSKQRSAGWGEAAREARAAPPPPAPAAPAMTLAAANASDNQTLDAISVTSSRIQEEAYAPAAADAPANGGQLRITLSAWQPDSRYARQLRAAAPAQVYALYLKERDEHANSSAFYLDVADILLERGQRELAIRVLSNLAEMQLENRHVLRVLGYRLMQANAPELAVPVFRQVLAMGEEEPQSFRDLGLALEAAGQAQAAVDALNEVVIRPWDARFDGISLIALDELNTLASRTKVNLDKVDPRLRRPMPLDLRVVLGWDSDNSDMDLWVTDPNGERAYYGNRLTWQGGQMSRDFTGGYGPEQFSLRQAKPGVYKVEANYFGSREQLVTGATTLMLRLTTKWGAKGQQDQYVTMRLKDDSETVLVGEFEVR
ncbi:VIT domain-containing protein [Stenotrophomonas oahuensis]|uniref:VIT domain-containing protein n=1 Tax=Stenotrophomonas oahuensis TaxID=3003271 RepID=A0ABY9YMD3_9GAMM|nr:VIT domain-containing protein [Stenotrophomonas sp. A5586]WNH51873.1 VIT domain-containing protein [Stenotrophomonas sp. A5586]